MLQEYNQPLKLPVETGRLCSAYLNLPEDELIPDAVCPYDASHELRMLPPVGQLQQPALHRGVGLPKDLHTDTSRNPGKQTEAAEKSPSRSLTLSCIRLRSLGTTGNTVGLSAIRSSDRRRMSPWKNPILAPCTNMIP